MDELACSKCWCYQQIISFSCHMKIMYLSDFIRFRVTLVFLNEFWNHPFEYCCFRFVRKKKKSHKSVRKLCIYTSVARQEVVISNFQHVFVHCSSSYSSSGAADDDINDVAAMGGVNLGEESQRILDSTGFVGTQIRSCKDDNFLLNSPLTQRIRQICKCACRRYPQICK